MAALLLVATPCFAAFERGVTPGAVCQRAQPAGDNGQVGQRPSNQRTVRFHHPLDEGDSPSAQREQREDQSKGRRRSCPDVAEHYFCSAAIFSNPRATVRTFFKP